jgi:ABC-type amino acid transport substrate-binding protein
VRRLVGLALAVLLGAAGAEAAQHEGLDAIRQRGALRVCADPANLPYSSNDPAMPGFEVELARLIADELGVTARLEWHPTQVRALKPLRDGACELFMGLPVDRRFREGNPWIVVSRPYYTMMHALVTRADGGALTMNDLKGKRVAVELASIAEFHVAYRDMERGLYRTQAEAFRAAAGGEAVAAFLWFPPAAWLARGRADLRVVAVSDEGLAFPIGAGVRKRDPGLGEAIDAAVARLLAAGRVSEVLARYGVVPAPRARGRSPFVLVEDKDPRDVGRSLFSTACSRCHGAEGVGGGTGGALPRLRNYEGGWERFYRLVWEGRKNTAMAAFRGILTPDEVRAVYEYLTSLPRQ